MNNLKHCLKLLSYKHTLADCIMTKYHYICHPCAKKAQKGANHDAGAYTAHMGTCDKCGKKEYLGHVRDFGLDNQLVFRNLTSLD